VLDVFCGTRPYDELLRAGSEVVGLDIDDRHGVADVVTDAFLPFPDESFDLVLCAEAFHYVGDPAAGVAELRRVLRHGGTAVVSVPLVWEYDPTILEHRFTGPELEHLFRAWDEVRVVVNGERAVVWATVTGRMLNLVEERLARGPATPVVRATFALAYLAVNLVASVAERVEGRLARGNTMLPMNLLLTARRP
jgi:SAM-dependent methyltransferase